MPVFRVWLHRGFTDRDVRAERQGKYVFISCPHHSPAAADPPALTGTTGSLGENSLSVGGYLHDSPSCTYQFSVRLCCAVRFTWVRKCRALWGAVTRIDGCVRIGTRWSHLKQLNCSRQKRRRRARWLWILYTKKKIYFFSLCSIVRRARLE